MKKVVLYIHGKGGSAAEAEQYRRLCPDYDIIGVDYVVDYPWVVEKTIRLAYDNAALKYDEVSVIANSIGAFFTMHALSECKITKAFFISPILDMEKLIYNMMSWAAVTERELAEKKEIETDFGETLSWDYLQYVKDNPIRWNVPTEILYAELDNLTSRDTAEAFAKSHKAKLTVMEGGEHWFHTDEQIAFLDKWIAEAIK